MYSCVLKNKEGIIFDEGKDFETLREAFNGLQTGDAGTLCRWRMIMVTSGKLVLLKA